MIPAAMLVLAACAAEPPEDDPLPLPPPPPPRLHAQRPVASPVRNGAEATGPTSDTAQHGQASVAAEAPDSAIPVAAALPLTVWRVGRDGTIGCANPASLRLLRQGAETMPRMLAEARAAGGCRTTFRLNAWVLEAQEDDIVRLRLTNGPSMTLWFARADVIAP